MYIQFDKKRICDKIYLQTYLQLIDNLILTIRIKNGL